MTNHRSETYRVLLLVTVLLLAGLTACGAPPAGTGDDAVAGDEAAAVEETAAVDEQPAGAAESPATPAKAAEAPKKQPAAASPPPRVAVTLPAGTEIRVILATPVDSSTSQIGDALEATTKDPMVVGNDVVIPAGRSIYGEVTDVIPATKGLDVPEKGGTLTLVFNRVGLADGTMTNLHASLTGTAKSGKKTGGIIGGSAAGGAVLGKILGKDSKDAAVGAVIGAGIGTAVAAGTKGAELKFPEGTELVVLLDEDLTVYVE